MSEYIAPVTEMKFVMNELADMPAISALPGYEDATPDLVDAVLEEAGKFANGVLSPINASGDEEGCVLENGAVRTPKGHKEAYGQFVEAGWGSLPFEPEFGGQGLPFLLNVAAGEMWYAANMGFSLCNLLTSGATEALAANASQELKQKFLPKMVSGEWTGTMNLTEPQAGSDLAQVRAKAVPDGDAYRISGQKIFITHGDHDYTDNIIHLVLARLPDAPAGVKGISLFLVPKIMVNDDGSLGQRNDARPVNIEHKLGINASPTCVMSFGDNDGAVGYLVGKENRGLECMFVMMNNARLMVGTQGVGIAQRAYQRAADYAKDRVQSRALGSSDRNPVSIIHHPDVRRMLMSMRAQTEAARAIAYLVGGNIDKARHGADPAERQQAAALVGLLTPIAKAYGSDVGINVADTGIQVHGGMGFIEETGAAQHLRDSRINSIYEGTNGIQANDLIGRKIAREGGVTMKSLIATMRQLDGDLASADGAEAAAVRSALGTAIDCLDAATDWLVETFPSDPITPSVGAVHYLRLAALTVGGWQMGRSVLAALRGTGNTDFDQAKLATARFYADQYMTEAQGLKTTFIHGGASAMAMSEGQF